MKMLRHGATDNDFDGIVNRTVLSSQWKNGQWQRMGKITRNVDTTTADKYVGWHVPYLAAGI